MSEPLGLDTAQPHELRILSARDVARALGMRHAIEVNRAAFQALDKGDAVVPERLILAGRGGPTLFKPALVHNSLGLKIISVKPSNEKEQLPTLPGYILVLDSVTGIARGLVEASYLTGVRTAAASAVASSLLARSDSSVLAVFGAGLQAACHIEAICCVRAITHVHIVNRNEARAQRLAAATRARFPLLHVHVSSAEQALPHAHIVCLCTNSSTPLFDSSLIPRGVHINGVGSYTPTMQELDSSAVLRSSIVLDCDEASRVGDLVQAQGELRILGTIGSLLNASYAHQHSGHDLTFFKSVGCAVQDIASAAAALERAEQAKLGQIVLI
jgi:ornithine cyclodeaminase